MPLRRHGPTLCSEVSAIRADDRALTLMVALAVVVAFAHFNTLGIAKPLEDASP
jgi:hypothetical protein